MASNLEAKLNSETETREGLEQNKVSFEVRAVEAEEQKEGKATILTEIIQLVIGLEL